ncbi:MAG: response regulator transcription factor [Fimbriimonadaceae bacterium]|nr:response regulator transcription factor [Fimbriimonadaceae bacterium]QYK57424.1 MAG: response regulator transcription factor [Fimbriimonadaceae bacterium]
MIRLLIADDHEVVRHGLRLVLGGLPDIDIVGEARSGPEALELIERLQPDVALLDLMMPELDGIAVARASGHPCVVLLTNYVDAARVREAIAAGVKGYVLKDVSRDELERAVRDVAEGRPFFHAEAQRCLVQAVQSQEPDPFEALTGREKDVLAAIARGRSNKEIGLDLGLTEGTVKGYVSSVLMKLGLQDRTQAALMAVRHGL